VPSPGERQPLPFAEEFLHKTKRHRLDTRADRYFRWNLIERPFEK
jgi:hypothetical protein